jgi:Flp pilus assembly pilin Flp
MMKSGKVRQRRSFARSERGSTTIEFALIAPLLLTLIFGVVEITNMLREDRKVSLADQTMIDMVSRLETVDEADRQELADAIQLVLQPYNLDYQATVAYVAFDDKGKPDFSSGSKTKQFAVRGSYLFSDAELAKLAKGLSVGNDGVIIGRVSSAYLPILANVPFIATGVRLTSFNAERPRTKSVTVQIPEIPPS